MVKKLKKIFLKIQKNVDYQIPLNYYEKNFLSENKQIISEKKINKQNLKKINFPVFFLLNHGTKFNLNEI